MRLKSLMIAVLFGLSWTCLAANNDRLRELYTADQAERQGQLSTDDWQELSKRDAARRTEVREALMLGQLRTAKDFHHAAMIMQHGDALEDIRMAHALASVSAAMNPTDRSASWLIAASWDRMLMYQKRPQWYGTQYVRGDDGSWVLYQIDESAVTDQDRTKLGAPTLAEAKRRVEVMNRARQSPN